MERVAKFSKVSFEQFKKDYHEKVSSIIPDDALKAIYDGIKLPERSTTGSAGYDFYLPEQSPIMVDKYTHILTGIRCEIADGYVLMLYPRSGLGFKFGTRLANTTGIIDSDYANAENEGHIQCKMIADKCTVIEAGKAFLQGVFLPYGITVDDAADGVRVGGFGSTGV